MIDTFKRILDIIIIVSSITTTVSLIGYLINRKAEKKKRLVYLTILFFSVSICTLNNISVLNLIIMSVMIVCGAMCIRQIKKCDLESGEIEIIPAESESKGE